MLSMTPDIRWCHLFVHIDFFPLYSHWLLLIVPSFSALFLLHHCCIIFSQALLSLWCSETHTPMLSHAAFLHNLNCAFIPPHILKPWSFSSLHLPNNFFLLPAASSCFHSFPLSPPLQICSALRALHFLHAYLYLYSSFFLSPLFFHSLSFTCPNGSLFTVSLPVSLSAVLTFSPTHAKRKKTTMTEFAETVPMSLSRFTISKSTTC